jgi:membrane associated rhomboid family serine protease
MANYNYRGGGAGLPPIPPVIKTLLTINIVVWVAQIFFAYQDIWLENWGALWSVQSGNFRIWQLITHMFMHESVQVSLDQSKHIVFGHIFFNMFTLWMFGSILENYWGPKRFLQFYMLCGIIAGCAELLLESNGGPAIGASGAIMGVMAGFAYLFPNTELYLFFIPIPIKAKYVITGLVALDLFAVTPAGAGDSVAHWAHLGGALAGLVIVIFWNKTRKKDFY